jgi:hypothetical protein
MQRTKEDIVDYGQALIAILKSFEVIEVKGSWFERILTKLLRPMYRHQLRSIVGSAPPEIANEIFSVIGQSSKQ